MNIIKKNATFVIANCFFEDGPEGFKTRLNNSEFGNKYNNFEQAPIKFTAKGVPDSVLESFPVIAFTDNDVRVLYSGMDRRIDISTNEYDKHKDVLKDILTILVDFKLTEISAIGINYRADCCTNHNRLSIFNEKINDGTFSNWSNNVGFTVTIPLSLEKFNCIGTYTVKKLAGGNDEGSFQPYIYQITVNYNFDIDKVGVGARDRLIFIERLVNNIEELYKDFNKKCEEITSL